MLHPLINDYKYLIEEIDRKVQEFIKLIKKDEEYMSEESDTSSDEIPFDDEYSDTSSEEIDIYVAEHSYDLSYISEYFHTTYGYTNLHFDYCIKREGGIIIDKFLRANTEAYGNNIIITIKIHNPPFNMYQLLDNDNNRFLINRFRPQRIIRLLNELRTIY